jgi:hypothetical protein
LPASDAVPISGTATTVTQVATIQLGYPIYYATVTAPPPTPPTTVVPGTRVQFVAPAPAATYGPVQWFRDNQKLPFNEASFEIAAATRGDSGLYYAIVKNANGRDAGSDAVQLLVAPAGLRLLNYSSRVEIDAAHPTVLSGLVVQPGPAGASTLLLVRAIGPTLASFNVAKVLAAPKLRIFDARGREVSPYTNAFPGLRIDEATRRVGAFPLPAGTTDVAHLYLVSPGAYALELGSDDAGSGTALLEVYEVPL